MLDAALSAVLTRRLATQRLTGQCAPVASYVGQALAVQSQDPGTARWSIGMRADCGHAQVCRAIDDGQIVRTHVLRPTWHYVHRDDLRWLQRLTGPKLARSMPARHRQLGLTPEVVDAALGALQRELGGGEQLTRKQLHPLMPVTGAPPGQVVGHLLMLAEAHGLICSGRLINGEHSYALVDDWLPAESATFDAERATRELVWRFFSGHGPASVKDLARWCNLTVTQIKAALADLDLANMAVDGVELWFDPDQVASPNGERQRRAFLLPTFDEVFLSYLKPNFPRSQGNPHGDRPAPFNEAGGGLVVVDLHDVGTWKRNVRNGQLTVRLDIDPDLDEIARAALAAECARLATFHELNDLVVLGPSG